MKSSRKEVTISVIKKRQKESTQETKTAMLFKNYSENSGIS